MSNAPDPGSQRESPSRFLAMGIVMAVYFATRISSVETLPIFLDEAVHLQWAERLWEEGRILRPVGSGRLLAVATYGLALPFEDRLWAVRLIAVMAGALTLVFTMLLSRRLFGARAGLVAGVLYVSSPFALVYDRLALSDGFLAAAVAGLMFATRVLLDDPRRLGPWVGLVAASTLAIVAKVSALLFLPAVPMAALTLAKDRRSFLAACALAMAATLVCASPMLWFFAANSGEIVSQHLADPDRPESTLVATLRDIGGWLQSYFAIPVLMAGAASLAWLRDGRALWLGGSFVLPLVLFALLSEPWSARYILPILPPLLILIAGGIEAVCARLNTGRANVAAFGLALAISLQGLLFDIQLFKDPSSAPFPADDRHQLITGWPAGYGVREAARRLEKESEAGPALVFVDTGGTRTLSTSLAVLLARHPRLTLVEGDFATSATRQAIVAEALKGTVFALLGPRSPGLDFRTLMEGISVERVEVYERPGGEWAATLFRVGVGSPR